MITRRLPVENFPLSPRAPLSPVGRLTAYGKLAFGHLPTGLGKPLRGFPQPPSFDDDLSPLSMHIFNCRQRTELLDAGHRSKRIPVLRLSGTGIRKTMLLAKGVYEALKIGAISLSAGT